MKTQTAQGYSLLEILVVTVAFFSLLLVPAIYFLNTTKKGDIPDSFDVRTNQVYLVPPGKLTKNSINLWLPFYSLDECGQVVARSGTNAQCMVGAELKLRLKKALQEPELYGEIMG
jgi:hypothetical protein